MKEVISGIKRKHQPPGIKIIYEDNDLIVIDKPAGLLTMGTDREKEHTVYFYLTDYVRRGNTHSGNRIFIVHRLDRETSGLLVFAKNIQTKNFLQENWHNFTKKYVAVVHGKLTEKDGELVSYLAENKIYRVYSVANPKNGKFSKSGYKVLKESELFSLLEIELFTGTKNQIRVQFADIGHPVAGDMVYGNTRKRFKRMALHAKSISFVHPVSKKTMEFETKIPDYFLVLVR